MSTLVICIHPQILPTNLAPERFNIFAAIVLYMALGGSLIANTLWNSAAQRLPVAIGGQLIIFETLCALLFGYMLAWTVPSMAEILGMIMVLGSVFWTIRSEGRSGVPTQVPAT
jgi:drug/metabolite transporter (DMT)-like permease